MTQNHFTISFPLKTPADAKALAEQLPPLMPKLFEAEDRIGTIHYSRFTVLSEKTLLFLGDFDGEFTPLMTTLAKEAGQVFDLIFQHVKEPRPLTCRRPGWTHSSNGPQNICCTRLISTARTRMRRPRKSRRWRQARVSKAAGELHPFLVILPTKSRIAFYETQLLLRARGRGITKDLDTVGTPHFAQFVPLEDNQIGFFTVYDGNFNDYIADFTKNIGQVFDLLFKFTRARRPRPAESTCRSSSISRRGRTGLRSGSIRRIPGCRSRTSMP